MTILTKSSALVLGGALIAAAGTAQAGPSEPRQVQVMGRTWTVSEDPDRPNGYVAVRDNNNLNPFGKPVARRTPQAVRALERATGCKVIRGSLWQTVGAEFHAQMACGG